MNTNNPKIKVPASIWEKVFNSLSIIAINGSFVYVIQSYGGLPDTIPIHFDGSGEPDGWGGRGTLFLMPIITIPMFLLLFILTKVPHTFNFPVKITEENAPRIYSESRNMMALFNFEIVAVFSFIGWETVQSAKNGVTILGAWFIAAMVIILIGTLIFFALRIRKMK